MIREEEFRGRRTPDVYTRRHGKLVKLNEKKPDSELVDRMDSIINKLDRITGAVEKLVDNCNIKIGTDFDELNQKSSNEEKHQSDEYVKDDLFTILDLNNSHKSDDGCEKTDKDESTAANNVWLDDILYSAVKIPLGIPDYKSLLEDDYLLDLKHTLISILNKEQDKKIMDELLPKESNDKKPKKTIFCILGESGSGKDTLVEYTLKEFKLDLKPVLSYTDRPIRQGEQNGKEHIFLSKDEMTEFLNSNKKDIAAYTQIGETGYRYCAMTSVIDRSDIYIIDPNGLKEFKERTGDRYNILSIYIDCPLEERRKRTDKRGDGVAKFEARVAAESEQFAKFREEHGYDHVIDNGSMSTIYRSAMTLADIFRHYRKDVK